MTFIKKLNYQVYIVNDPEFNAYALVGGIVIINTGLLNIIENESELAFVLAHELGHQDLQHCAQQVQYSTLASNIEPELSDLVQLAYSLYYLPFSKQDEYAADKYGINLMKKAGYHKQGAIQFFQRLKKISSASSQKRDPMNDFIATHGSLDERIARIK